jgi:hypothetical protein
MAASEGFRCVHCGRTSYYQDDIVDRWCAFCLHLCDEVEE